MSTPVQRRIEALEAMQGQLKRWLWWRVGETIEQAKARAGFTPANAVLVFAWASSKPNTRGAA